MIFKAHKPMWDDCLWLLIAKPDERGDVAAYVSQMTLVEHKRGEAIDAPSLNLSAPEAQNLMDALWGVGLRPSSGEGNAGHIGAVEKHLEDMRRLVFTSPPKGPQT